MGVIRLRGISPMDDGKRTTGIFVREREGMAALIWTIGMVLVSEGHLQAASQDDSECGTIEDQSVVLLPRYKLSSGWRSEVLVSPPGQSDPLEESLLLCLVH